MGRKILIVDDNKINRQMLCKILSGDYRVLEACNGREALEILAQTWESISAVILDIFMPEMDGYDVLIEMRSDENLSQIPVIVASSNTEEATEVKALSLGANDYIIKPYNPAVIKHRLWNTIKLRETAAVINSAKRDKLTGLYNREAFFEEAAKMIAAREPGYYVISCFDVDNFKIINDQYGSEKGDEILKFIGRTFNESFGELGGISCRIAEDNFAVLYPQSFMESKEVEEIRRLVTEVDGLVPPITFSAGRYLINDFSLSIGAMYDRAVIAEALVKGRFDSHVATYDESMRRHILQQQEIVSEMNTALENREFEVWFQPQYNHYSGAVIGAEALARWRHPKKGIIPPGEFIPLFEQNGFIYQLDKYVWEQTCILLRKWIDEGLEPVPVSVNISRYDIFCEDLIDVITNLVKKYEIPEKMFCIEITESAFAKSTEQIISVVKKLMEYGFTVGIDDFGSGYSSFNTLKDVPVDILKLDMRFLERNDDSSRGGNILEAIIRMSKWLGMSVIAEGVETWAQADYLKSIGCNYVQGYLYDKPMEAEKYEKLIISADKEKKLLRLETIATLDNDAFWDPKSMDTLIFNSYVGAACVFEFYQETVEMLRVNDKYAKTLGGEDCTIADALNISWGEHINEAERTRMISVMEEAINTGQEVTCQAMFFGLPGAYKESCLRTSLRVIARAGERFLFYCTLENLTEQWNAEQKELKVSKQLLFLNEAAHDLITGIGDNSGIQKVLEKTLEYFDGNRSYIMELNYEKEVFSNTYEACAEGVSSEIANLQNIPFEIISFWVAAFEKGHYINIEDTDAIGDERAAEKQILKRQKVKSLVAVPIWWKDRLIGFLGVDDPRRNQTHVDHLRGIGDFIAAILSNAI